MRRRAVSATVVVVLSVVCTACTNDDSASPAPARSTRSSAAVSPAADVPPPPQVGQCRNTPESNLGQDDWIDDSPAIDCSRTHTLETVEVIKPTTKLTLPLVKQLVDSCNTPAAGSYLGSPTTPIGLTRIVYPLVYWPTPAQRAAGQSWVRCDVGVGATTHCCRPVAHLAQQTASLRGVVGTDPGRFLLCLHQVINTRRAQPLTSCKKPHRTEDLPSGPGLSATHYPSSATLRAEGRSQCAHFASRRDDVKNLIVTPVWQPPASFSGGTLYGACWIRRKAGLLPAIP
jgi:hypothetical protein